VVFVVDDEAVIAETLAIILNHAGFQAIAFDHPEKAIVARKAGHGNDRVWKAWKAMKPASHPSHTLWKSLRDSH